MTALPLQITDEGNIVLQDASSNVRLSDDDIARAPDAGQGIDAAACNLPLRQIEAPKLRGGVVVPVETQR